jgi:uncharacterized protein
MSLKTKQFKRLWGMGLDLIALTRRVATMGVVLGFPLLCAAASVPLANSTGVSSAQCLLLAKTVQGDADAGLGLAPSAGSTKSGREAAAGKTLTGKRGHTAKPGKLRHQTTKPKQPAPVRPKQRKARQGRRERMAAPPQCPTEPSDAGISILVVGDSLAIGVGMTLDSAFEGHGKVRMKKMGRISSGLDSPAFYDWNSVLKEVLEQEHFDLVVVMLGANDAHNSSGTPTWGRLYQSKFAALLRITAEKQIRTLVVGLPPMRKPDFCQRVKVANEAIRNASQLFPKTCVYIDSFRRFADESGDYTDRVQVKGEWKKARAGDGVHFTGTGYLVLSKMVVDEALRHSGSSAMGAFPSRSAGARGMVCLAATHDLQDH